jgi:predicted TIM-barrel fold metal-dependent hydrolase
MDLPFIDAHVHLSRDTAQERQVFPKPGAADAWFWASPDKVGRYLDWFGMSHVVFLNIMDTRRMTRARLSKSGATPTEEEVDAVRRDMQSRVSRFNDWGCEIHRRDRRLVPCVYIDPVLFGVEGAISELERSLAAGATGVKMHPDISGFRPDEQQLWPLFARMQELDVPVVFDTGASRHSTEDHGRPALFADLLESFPRLTVVLAHLASAYWDEREDLAARFPNVVFDTAGGFNNPMYAARGGLRALPEDDAVRLIRKIGAHRVMFGSDGPAFDPFWQAHQIARLPLERGELELVLSGTARRVYRLQ